MPPVSWSEWSLWMLCTFMEYTMHNADVRGTGNKDNCQKLTICNHINIQMSNRAIQVTHITAQQQAD